MASFKDQQLQIIKNLGDVLSFSYDLQRINRLAKTKPKLLVQNAEKFYDWQIEEISQRINEIGESFIESLNECQKALAELKESKKEGKWKPSQDEKFWYRSNAGIIVGEWFDECSVAQVWKINNIPVFKTKEECERYWHFMDTVKEKSYEFTADEWKNNEIKKYTIYYNFLRGEFATTYISDSKFLGEIYFKEKSIVVIGNESKGVSKEIMDLADIKIKIPMLRKNRKFKCRRCC